jgi:GNAT superfamily N-acetyltransferase
MLSIRPATVNDADLLALMIRELAEYEKELDSVKNTASDLARDGFGPSPKFRAMIAESDGETAGYALVCEVYSTWTGRHLYLEDLYVRPQFRGKGIGKALMAKVARLAIQENYYAMRWEVLDWNKPSIEVYRGLGAEFLEAWRLMWLTGEPLRELAESAP